MKKTRRTAQVGDVIRKELSALFQRELSSLNLGLASVTDVEVATDLRFARVFVSTLAAEDEGQQMIDRLTGARGKIRHLLGGRISLRYTPDLEFRLDTTAARAMHIEQLLHEVLPPEQEKEGDDDNDDDDDR